MNRKYDWVNGKRKNILRAGMGLLGFTLIEVMIALALVSVLMTAMIALFSTLNQSCTTQSASAGVQQVVRTGIDIMAQNIRMAGYNPLKLPEVGLSEDLSSDRIHFTFDLNEDGAIANEEDITFLLHDNRLKRKIKDGYRITLIENVSVLKFSYLNVRNEPTQSPGEVKTVIISMTVNEPAGRKQSISRTYATRVLCRNLCLQ
jgi:prepilin-type N-terminal cleavage/methylation domain-containing protein